MDSRVFVRSIIELGDQIRVEYIQIENEPVKNKYFLKHMDY